MKTESTQVDLLSMIIDGPLDRKIYNLICRLALDDARYEILMTYELDVFVLVDRYHIRGPFSTYQHAQEEGCKEHGTTEGLFLVQQTSELQVIITLIRNKQIQLP